MNYLEVVIGFEFDVVGVGFDEANSRLAGYYLQVAAVVPLAVLQTQTRMSRRMRSSSNSSPN